MNALPNPDEACLDDIASHVRKRFGIVVPADGRDTFRSALRRLGGGVGTQDLGQLRQRILAGGGELDRRLAEAVSVNHTAFFREPEVLDFFEREVLPTFSPSRQRRIWSAASSTGEEAYTLAMMACERFGPDGAAAAMAILGTDVSEKVVGHATRGVYGPDRMRGVRDDLKARYFEPGTAGRHRVKPILQRMVMFRRLNLKLEPWPFQQRFDVVFCRNVLYYFDEAQQANIVNRIASQTSPGCYLFTSVTENIRELTNRWETVIPGVHRRGL